MTRRTRSEERRICERLAVYWLHPKCFRAAPTLLDVPKEITARQLARLLEEVRDAARTFPDAVKQR